MISPDSSTPLPPSSDTPPAPPKSELRAKAAPKGKPRIFYRDPVSGEQTETKPKK